MESDGAGVEFQPCPERAAERRSVEVLAVAEGQAGSGREVGLPGRGGGQDEQRSEQQGESEHHVVYLRSGMRGAARDRLTARQGRGQAARQLSETAVLRLQSCPGRGKMQPSLDP